MMTRQTYNFVAKRIREDFPTSRDNDTITLVKRGTLVDLSLRCAYGFMQDNARFDPHWFLDACSPDPSNYPITELWDSFLKERQNELDEIAQNGS